MKEAFTCISLIKLHPVPMNLGAEYRRVDVQRSFGWNGRSLPLFANLCRCSSLPFGGFIENDIAALLAFHMERTERPLQEFEAEVKKDVYNLVSHFDAVLNDPDADWTGQRTNDIPSNTQLPPLPQPSIELPTPKTRRPDNWKDPEPSNPPTVPATSGNGEKKRKRDEPTIPDEPKAKHVALSEHEDENSRTPEITKPTPRASRRRRPPPPPSDRVLRPWRK